MTPTIDELVVADAPGAWERAGFLVDRDRLCRIGSIRVRLVGRSRGLGIVGWSLRDADIEGLGAGATIDRIPTSISERAACLPAVHPNGVRSIDHVVIVTPDSARTTSALEAVGFEVRRVREVPESSTAMIQTFFRAGEGLIELVGPTRPRGDGPAAFYGLAYTVADLDASAVTLGDDLGPIKDATQPGRRIATLHHAPLDLSVRTALMSAG